MRVIPRLIVPAVIISLLGFMEAISIAKAMAAKTRQRLDPDQELIGQGLANIAGSFFSAFTVSGSFSRSAVAARAGAKTGLFAIISASLVYYWIHEFEALNYRAGAENELDALVSVAGSVNGSPLADRYAGLYSAFSGLSVPGCPAGDGQLVASLTRPLNLRRLAENPLPTHVRYFSLGAYADAPHTARALRMLFASDLARMEPRNDGQTLFYDQVIPGSVLLGYLNGDHWDVVIPLREKMPFLAGNSAGSPDFPRPELLTSIVLFLEQYLTKSRPADALPNLGKTPPSPVP